MMSLMAAASVFGQEFNPIPRAWKWIDDDDVIFTYDGTFEDSTAFAVNVRAGKRTDGVKAPARYADFPVKPDGAVNARSFAHKCTACQLCVSACPNNVLRPSSDLDRFMQPEASYERGYCRPECTSCSNVCPNGALLPLTREEKSSTQIGRAVWIKQNCLAASKNERCDNCARHCPTGAIQMVAPDEGDKKDRRIPVIDVERCIGCGACENLCPARPFSGIVVEGVDTQKLM